MHAIESHLLIHVLSYLCRLGLSDLDTTDMEGIDNALHFRNVGTRSSSEGQNTKVRMMSGDVGENRGVCVVSRSFVSLVCQSAY